MTTKWDDPTIGGPFVQMCPLQMSEIRVPVTFRPRGHECRRAVAFAFKQLSSVAFGHTAVWCAASQLAKSVSKIFFGVG